MVFCTRGRSEGLVSRSKNAVAAAISDKPSAGVYEGARQAAAALLAAGLGRYQWVRRHQPGAFPQFRKGLFDAHFVLGEDIEDPAVIDRHASEAGIDLAALHASMDDDRAAAAVTRAEMMGHKYGVQGTPAWLLGYRLIAGLLPAVEFERLADAAAPLRR